MSSVSDASGWKVVWCCLAVLGWSCAIAADGPLVVEDAAERSRLPESVVVPAAPVSELTPANGWPSAGDYRGWSRSLGGPSANRFSMHDQITRDNVNRLAVAWVYRSGDGKGNVQCNPIEVDGVIYTSTAGRGLAAVDARTGRERWRTDLGMKLSGGADAPARRGILHLAGEGRRGARLLFPAGGGVMAVDPRDGRRIESFGDGGWTRLPAGSTAGGAVCGRVLVVPGYEKDVYGVDVESGRILWTFNTVPGAEERGGETWVNGRSNNAANCWGGIAMDEPRGIVYFTTGSPKPNFDGTQHHGDNLYSNCLVALRAETGAYLWHVQEIRHDIWDLDMPAPPNLVTVEREGRKVDAVAAVSKTGVTLLVDRVSGRHLFPHRLRRAPTSLLPGERTAAYQADPELPERFARHEFRREDITERTPEARSFVERQLARARMGWYEAFELNRPTVFYSTHGGAEWTGAAFNPLSGRLYVTVNHRPSVTTVFRDDDPKPVVPMSEGEKVYQTLCAACHGKDRTGVGGAPPLRGLRHHAEDGAVRTLLKTGRGLMPPQPGLEGASLDALLDFLMCRDRGKGLVEGETVRYGSDGYRKLDDHEGYPGVKPPWGSLACLDLNTGRRQWQVVLGEHEELTAKGVPKTGTHNFGGAMVTAGGVVFASGTMDSRVYAFDAADGRELWSAKMPFAGSAPPMTYVAGGRQYVLVPATGGGKTGMPSGDAWVAFALPE